MRIKLTDEASIRDIIREMTLEEKKFIVTSSPCIFYSIDEMEIFLGTVTDTIRNVPDGGGLKVLR